MPYIDVWPYFDTKLCPQEGETYQAFRERCLAGLKALKPDMPDGEAEQLVESAWANHILRTASEVTLTMKRELNIDSVYAEPWWSDWRVTEIHSAKTATIVYSSIEKSKKELDGKFQIAKTVEDKQLVFGWANIAKDANGNYPIDWHGDVTEPEELEKAAYTFVLKYRAMGENHEGEATAHLIESVMFTKEKQAAMGIPEGILPEGWWTGFYIPDKEVFAKVKSGEYKMLSIQGTARRVPIGQ